MSTGRQSTCSPPAYQACWLGQHHEADTLLGVAHNHRPHVLTPRLRAVLADREITLAGQLGDIQRVHRADNQTREHLSAARDSDEPWWSLWLSPQEVDANRSGRTMTMKPDKTVLVVVDVQNGFVGSRSHHVVPVIVDLVHSWQARGGSTIFSRYFNYAGSPYERLIGWTRMHGAPETDLVTELQPYAAKATAVVDKTIYSLFNDQGTDVLARGGWTDLLICGIATESCVCKTAVDAFERNLTPWVLVDACASHAGTVTHEAGLVVTGRFIGKGQLISTSDLSLRGLLASA